MKIHFEEHAHQELRDAIAYYEAIECRTRNSLPRCGQRRNLVNPPVSTRMATVIGFYKAMSYETVSLRDYLQN